MDPITELQTADAALDDACSAVKTLRNTTFWRLADGQVMDLAGGVEQLYRLLFGLQVELAAEIDTRKIAAEYGVPSTAVLLRQKLLISHQDAALRVSTARATQSVDGISGGEIPAALPLLADALNDGAMGVEQTRTIVASMRKLPDDLDPGTREACQRHLVEQAQYFEPKPFAAFARAVVETCTPDGTLDDEDRAARIEFTLGRRNPETGMTRFHGQLDDVGVEIVSQAIDGLSKPQPSTDSEDVKSPQPDAATASAETHCAADSTDADAHIPADADPSPNERTGTDDRTDAANARDAEGASTGPVDDSVASSGIGRDADADTDSDEGGTLGAGPADTSSPNSGIGRGADSRMPDQRSAACRRGQALVEALRRFLCSGVAPIQGGERPHVTVTIALDDLNANKGVGYLDFGGPISAGTARMLACDAMIIPAVLGSNSQVLDVGMASRLFPTAIRRAIALRDKGCAFPGCDRPAAWADCHHIVHWVDHGPSSYLNGCLLCPAHHREIHRGFWEVRMAADGRPEFLPPEWIDKQRRPLRNTSHHLPELLTVRN